MGITGALRELTARLAWLDLAVIAIATWRLAYMISSESGPWNIFVWLRQRLALGGLTSCIMCLSVWVGAAMLALHLAVPIMTWALAASGLALMLRSYTGVGLHD